jgi:hypothetical protein
VDEFRNVEYWRSFQAFFQRLFSEIALMPDSAIPKELTYMLEVSEERGHWFDLVTGPSVSSLIEMLIERIRKWPEYNHLLKHAILPGCYGDIWTDSDHFYVDRTFIPSIAWQLYWDAGTSFRVSDADLRKQYQLIENALYLSEYRFRVAAPLHNLELSTPAIELGQGLYLRRLEKKDLNLFRPSIRHPYLGAIGYSPFKTMVITEETRQKGAPSGIADQTHAILTHLAAAIAVYCGERIQLGPIFSEPLNVWCMSSGMAASCHPGQVPLMAPPSAKLHGDSSEVTSFWSRYRKSSQAKSLAGFVQSPIGKAVWRDEPGR